MAVVGQMDRTNLVFVERHEQRQATVDVRDEVGVRHGLGHHHGECRGRDGAWLMHGLVHGMMHAHPHAHPHVHVHIHVHVHGRQVLVHGHGRGRERRVIGRHGE